MKLTNLQIQQILKLFSSYSSLHIDVYENGIFEISNINESAALELYDKMKTISFSNLIYKFIKDISDDNSWIIIGKINPDIIDESQVNEDIQIHNELNDKLWNKDEELLPGIAEKIEDIVELFVKQLEEDGIELRVEDIYLVGSNVNYNYTDRSDLDIHIIADESFDCASEHLPIIYNAYKALFNSKYDIKINGVNVELYVENKDALSNISAGIYSLNHGWINKPSISQIPKIDKADFEHTLQIYENEYLELLENPSLEKVESFIDRLYELRLSGIKTQNEFSTGNLVFKEFRYLGYLDELRELKIKLINDKLSL